MKTSKAASQKSVTFSDIVTVRSENPEVPDVILIAPEPTEENLGISNEKLEYQFKEESENFMAIIGSYPEPKRSPKF